MEKRLKSKMQAYNISQFIATYNKIYTDYVRQMGIDSVLIYLVVLGIPISIFLILYFFSPILVKYYNLIWYSFNRKARITRQRNKESEGFSTGIVVGLLILLLFSVFGYIFINSLGGEHFTDMLMLNSQGTIGKYPNYVQIYQNNSVYLVIQNHEGRPMLYQLEVIVNNGTSNSTLDTLYFIIMNGHSLTIPVNYTFYSAGTYKVMFLLYSYDPHSGKFIYDNVFTQIPVSVET